MQNLYSIQLYLRLINIFFYNVKFFNLLVENPKSMTIIHGYVT